YSGSVQTSREGAAPLPGSNNLPWSTPGPTRFRRDVRRVHPCRRSIGNTTRSPLDLPKSYYYCLGRYASEEGNAHVVRFLLGAAQHHSDATHPRWESDV